MTEHIDTGWSRAKESRPELNRIVREARQRCFDCVLAWKLDRLRILLKVTADSEGKRSLFWDDPGKPPE